MSIILFSCKNPKEIDNGQKQIINKQLKSSDYLSLIEDINGYVPKKNDLSQIVFLNKYDIKNILNNNKITTIEKEEIINTLLLKQYLFHLRKSNQGFDLKPMSRGNTKFIIQYFLKINNISNSKEFINSAVAYNILKKNREINTSEINNIINLIDKENQRIIRESKIIIGE